MKARLLLWFAVTILLASCTGNNQSNDGTKLLDYKYFTIRVPESWKRVNARGIDSFVGEIHIDSNTIINFDLGWYSNNLVEGSEDYVIRHDSLFVLRELPISFSNQIREDYRGKPDSSSIAAITVNRKQWITIDGYKAKLITPTMQVKEQQVFTLTAFGMQEVIQTSFK